MTKFENKEIPKIWMIKKITKSKKQNCLTIQKVDQITVTPEDILYESPLDIQYNETINKNSSFDD